MGIYSSEAWYANSSKKWFNPETAFKERANFANITAFDLGSNSYSFGISRHKYALNTCGMQKIPHKDSFSDFECLRSNGVQTPIFKIMDAHYPGACALVNR